MNIPPMEWRGWFTLVLPLYFLISLVIGYALSNFMFITTLGILNHLLIAVVLMLIAGLISIYAYKMYDDWTKLVVVSLLTLDLLLIINTTLLFVELFRL